MTFKDAIEFHVMFNAKLLRYCKKPDGSLNPDIVVKSDICALGQWIDKEKNKHNNDPLFEELKTSHDKFHVAAAGVVRRVNAGHDVKSDLSQDGKGTFAEASIHMTDLLYKAEEKFKDEESA